MGLVVGVMGLVVGLRRSTQSVLPTLKHAVPGASDRETSICAPHPI